jgi:hypothetical protein
MKFDASGIALAVAGGMRAESFLLPVLVTCLACNPNHLPDIPSGPTPGVYSATLVRTADRVAGAGAACVAPTPQTTYATFDVAQGGGFANETPLELEIPDAGSCALEASPTTIQPLPSGCGDAPPGYVSSGGSFDYADGAPATSVTFHWTSTPTAVCELTDTWSLKLQEQP